MLLCTQLSTQRGPACGRRYGPYLKSGDVSAPLPKGRTLDSITEEEVGGMVCDSMDVVTHLSLVASQPATDTTSLLLLQQDGRS
jgi:topoisomerase IA-like protein